MATGSEISFGVCSVLMASLFAVSESFQFNDSDWYIWIPLYASASIVNLVNGVKISARSGKMAKFVFWLGVFLFVKVVMENIRYGIAGFWSIDMRERVAREKLGSWLVISSMFLQLDYSSDPDHRTRFTKYDNPILVVFAYGLSFGFFTFQHEEMRH